MNEKLLKEYIDRVGLVTGLQLAQQVGVAHRSWREPALKLMEERDFFVCRLDHGAQTFVSRHLLFCLRAVYTEPLLSSEAQDLYDWLCDNELTSKKDMGQAAGVAANVFEAAFHELQEKLCIASFMARPAKHPAATSEDEFELDFDFLWVSYEYWINGLHKPPRYGDLAYCLSEIKRLMGPRFTSGEINQLIYHGEL